jgi:GWxTD domain-containing protein
MKKIITILLLSMVLSGGLFPAKTKIKDLSAYYRKWLQEEVVYIISSTEKKMFLELSTDPERNAFIEAFWKNRDPNPNTEVNEFKEEHYQRIAFANKNFGRDTPGAGWRTEMGRMYIILGEPAQKQQFLNTTGLHPTIIWFYAASPEKGLPQAFNVVFFQEDNTGEYKLYSPVRYGPAKLLYNYMGDEQQHAKAYNELMGIEPDVAATSLTLYPSENAFTSSPSMASEVLITSKIPESAYNKVDISYAEKLIRYRGIVNVDQLVNYVASEAMVKIIRDSSGIHFCHYLLEPKKLSLEQHGDFLYSNLEISGKFTDLNGDLIYQFDKKVPIKFPVSQMHSLKDKLFSFQDLLPLLSGQYKYSILVINSAEKEFFSFEGDLMVPDSNGMKMGQMVLASSASENLALSGSFKPFYLLEKQLLPSPRNDFNSQDTMHIFLQIYNLDQELKQSGLLRYQIISESDDKLVLTEEKPIKEFNTGTETDFLYQIPLTNLPYAYYTVKVSLLNKAKQVVLAETADFYIAPLKLARPWVLSLPYTDKTFATQYNILGIQLMNKKQWAAASEMLQRAHAMQPASVQFAMDYAKILFKQQQFDSVLTLTEPFLSGTDRPVFLQITGQAHRALQHYDQAISLFKEYLQANGLHVQVLNVLAECHYKLGQLGEAVELFRVSLKEDANQPKVSQFINKIEKELNEKKIN